MCGRYTLTRSGRKLRDAFDLDDAPPLAPRYNIAPTQESLVVRPAADGRRRADLATWGFTADGGGRLLINARAETADRKPSFRHSFAHRRCLVPADGFYEWRRSAGRGRSRPFHFSPADGGFFAFGGLWKPALAPGAGPELAFSILTVPANQLVARVHPRMPLILPPAAWGSWLDGATERQTLAALLAPCADEEMAMREVSTAVNSVAHDSPACLAPPRQPDAVQLDLLT